MLPCVNPPPFHVASHLPFASLSGQRPKHVFQFSDQPCQNVVCLRYLELQAEGYGTRKVFVLRTPLYELARVWTPKSSNQVCPTRTSGHLGSRFMRPLAPGRLLHVVGMEASLSLATMKFASRCVLTSSIDKWIWFNWCLVFPVKYLPSSSRTS